MEIDGRKLARNGRNGPFGGQVGAVNTQLFSEGFFVTMVLFGSGTSAMQSAGEINNQY